MGWFPPECGHNMRLWLLLAHFPQLMLMAVFATAQVTSLRFDIARLCGLWQLSP
jgi:hypothetical protein